MNFRKFKTIVVSSLLLFSFKAWSQNSSDILHQILKLQETGSVLYLAAHPDDENTNLIAYLSNERHYRTGYLALTRGDGGQNLIGSELGVNLGLIRTEELMAARRIDGGEQFFTRAFDFGFSKNPKETFTIWNKDSLLKDVVKCIRQYKPDVIVCRFPEDSRAGHGHHSASAILASEAFDIAGNPNIYPDQVKEFGIWQPKRLFWNTFNFGENNTTSADQLQLEVGGYNALLGKSYGEIAAQSRSQHKCQGFGSAAERGKRKEYFKLLKGDSTTIDIMDGVQSAWQKYKNAKEIEKLFKNIISQFKSDNPSKSVSDLLLLRKEITSIPESSFKSRKLKELDKIILSTIGFYASYTTAVPIVSAGDSIETKLQILVRSNIEVFIGGLKGIAGDSLNKSCPSYNNLKTISLKSLAANSITQPYWLGKEHSKGMFTIDDLGQIGKPRNDAPNTISFSLSFNVDTPPISVTLPLEYNHTDPAKGELTDPLAIAPKVTAKINDPFLYFNLSNKKTISVSYQYHGNTKAKFELSNEVSGNGWNIISNETSLLFSKNGDEKTIEYTIEKSTLAKSESLKFFLTNEQGKKEEIRSIKEIHYDHIPSLIWYPEATISLKAIDLKIPQNKIAYIKGAGDVIPASLKAIGFNIEEFSASQLEGKDLSQYTAIITGIRAYNVDNRLSILQPQLLNYVKNGGRLVIQYNTPSNSLPENLGPYPLTVGKNRVTEEDAIVTISDSTLSILNTPNKITRTDFNNWIQERGIYFAETNDKNYVQPLRMNDKGENSLSGSLLYCKYGKGTYIYTGLSFFREIPAGVDGATRLFVNLISE
ncbi:MAG TPA: PIG-L family deacetylase [Bacteroidia bacterium]|nr:PIG-L family deacetylase [Bacteroidia bacterium]